MTHEHADCETCKQANVVWMLRSEVADYERLAEAFEAMRESLCLWIATIERCNDTYKLATDIEAPAVMRKMRAALEQANSIVHGKANQ